MIATIAEPVSDAPPDLRIAIYGAANVGKSSLVNALVNREVAAISARGGETSAVRRVALTMNGAAPTGEPPVALVLIDTPGIDEPCPRVPAHVALAAVDSADLVLMVVDADMTALELRALEAVRERAKPVIVVLNKTDLMTPRQRDETEAALHRRLDRLIGAENIVSAAARPRPRVLFADAAPGHDDEQEQLPRTEALRQRIGDIARREGSALRQLRTLLDCEAEIAAQLRLRRKRARRFVEASAAATALAVALNPSPLLDVLGGMAALTAIVTGVASAYDTAISPLEAQGVARELWRAGRLQLGGILAAGACGSLLKALPGFGTASGALMQAGAVGYFCYVFGEAVIAYVERGKSWNGGAAETTLRDIITSLDREAVTRRILDQVKTKLPFS